uniref:hypothetical protein n=1 Tax=Cupriavidus necator TaxID=106590 RepID=UPI003F496104
MRHRSGQYRPNVDPVAKSVAIILAMLGVSAQFLFSVSDASAQAVRDALVATLRRALFDPARTAAGVDGGAVAKNGYPRRCGLAR